ncbi:molecular chaperone (plasmid) [Klebsiella pasteurii]|uniref:fimbrial biogenesis chaperone n=1 Tax=Klebsiella pasteurii TaxID=2587529 RepID=UPI0025437B70|nr:molecular chaperone [Klebsiella pasteurii]WII85141.1 molecular chaperone [Klebsiella pasteurii]
MKIIRFAFTMMIFAGLINNASAGVSLGQTRLVYPQEANSKTITLRNSGSDVYLVQAAVTDWETNEPVKDFTVLPPIFRLESHSSNALRVVRTGGNFPLDRESIFHLRINAIPSRTAPEMDQIGASLSISLGMGIKLFYRPEGLTMAPNEAYGRLTFQRRGQFIAATNPTPYYLTLSHLSFGGVSVDLDKTHTMIPPFSEINYPSASGSKAEWTTITDFGGKSDVFYATIK